MLSYHQLCCTQHVGLSRGSLTNYYIEILMKEVQWYVVDTSEFLNYYVEDLILFFDLNYVYFLCILRYVWL